MTCSMKKNQCNCAESGIKCKIFFFKFCFSKPTTSGVTKRTKSGKQNGDDITLPLMEKNQGQKIVACLPLVKLDSIIIEMKNVSFTSG